MDDDTLVYLGTEVKSLGAGRVGGYLVVFGSAERHDLSEHKDYFTRDTYFGAGLAAGPIKADVYYHHGLDPTMRRRRLGVAELKADDAGVWAEAQIAMADEYAAKVLALVEAGKLRWSSGTAAHTVERKEVGAGVHEVLSWPLGADASLTPTPAEPRAMAVSLKSLIEAAPGAGPHAGLTLDAHSQSVLAAVSEFVGRIDGYAAMKASDGRPVSPARREQFRALHERLGALLGRISPPPAADIGAVLADFYATRARDLRARRSTAHA